MMHVLVFKSIHYSRRTNFSKRAGRQKELQFPDKLGYILCSPYGRSGSGTLTKLTTLLSIYVPKPKIVANVTDHFPQKISTVPLQ